MNIGSVRNDSHVISYFNSTLKYSKLNTSKRNITSVYSKMAMRYAMRLRIAPPSVKLQSLESSIQLELRYRKKSQYKKYLELP